MHFLQTNDHAKRLHKVGVLADLQVIRLTIMLVARARFELTTFGL
jgi:hypothetical protein